MLKGSVVDANVSLRNKAFLASAKQREMVIRASRAGVHPDVLRFEKRFRLACSDYGIPVYANEFVRDRARQNALRSKGFSRALYGQSPHNFGLAVDIVHSVRFWELERSEWLYLSEIGKEAARKCGVKIEWGGDFRSFYDPAHWQLANWREHVDL